jgi:hypothetical protein
VVRVASCNEEERGMTREELKALAEQAFIGPTRNITAIGKLTVAIGEAGTLELAKQYGIETLFAKGRGKRPDLENVLDEYVEVANDEAAKAEAKRALTVSQALERPLPKNIGGSVTNPYSNHKDNLDADGNYNAKAIARQTSLMKVNMNMAAAIAKAAGVTVTATRPLQPQGA